MGMVKLYSDGHEVRGIRLLELVYDVTGATLARVELYVDEVYVAGD